MRFFLILCVLSFATLLSQTAMGQNINEYVTTGSPDSWVNVQKIPSQDNGKSSDRATEYLLVDRQYKFLKENRSIYVRIAEKLETPTGVEDNSTIEISFDPLYQKIKIHQFNLIRNGTVFDRLDLSKVDLYRKETDRDKLIYNGDLQLSYVIPDVQVGDIIDYAYTSYGKNPAVGPHFSVSFQHQYLPPIQHLNQRLLIDERIEVNRKTHANAPEPQIATLGGFKEYSWSFKNREGVVVDGDTPNWYYSYPKSEFSSFANWAEVGKYFAPFYEPPTEISKDLSAVIDQIKRDNSSPEKRLREALQFVQREIRYLGIELGEGGYIPRDPNLVLSRKFGDCKDVTRLLTTLLKGLDIEATPLLVDFDLKAGVDDMLPNYGAFDHVIVHAKLNGKSYFLDATKGEQMGDIDHLQQGVFGKGVVISDDSPGMIDAQEVKPDYWKVYTDTYDLVSDPETIGFESVSTYYMAQADSTRSWIEQEGMAAVEKKYLEYYQNRFPTIEQLKPLEVEKFENSGKLTIKASYKIPKAWDKDEDTDQKSLSFFPSDLNADFPDFVGAKRTAPYTFSHPIRTLQTLNFLVDESWSFEDNKTEYSLPAFDFTKTETAKDNVYSEAYHFVTKADHITVEDFARTMTAIDEIDDISGVNLSPSLGDADMTIEDYFWIVSILWLLIGIGVSLIVAVSRRHADQGWREKLILYPVSMPKFLLLSIVTVGFYQLFWIYKNWVWLKQVKGQDVSPGWRTFFATIMNFSLFSHIKDIEAPAYPWYKYAAFPLALLYFLSTVLGSATGSWEESPLWIDLLTFCGLLAVVPVAMQVMKMNEGREESIALNSKFDWPVIGLIAACLPLPIFVIYGMTA